MNLKHPFISVIIPTYHDWQRLQLCLDAIDTQSYPKEKFEIIVVNNDPLDFPSGMTWPNNCSVVVESKSGSYAARNKGASHAKGKVFSFTDADCIPDKNWLSEIASHYSYNKGILSGSVIMFSMRANNKLNFTESYDYIFGINQEIYKRSKVAATANLSVTSEEFFFK
ncbi:glycosyltransferase [Oceanisphaera psychrotolerans]|uniref:glycosyltransferase n=1 Tax=Oceanisphaera psychrotolerans TaxID=1414654 RepID=UPI001587DEE2|nr:glycosyltransferase family A protein [Oceanisphaera psychrotolerans]